MILRSIKEYCSAICLSISLIFLVNISYAQTEITGDILEMLNTEINSLSNISDNSYQAPDNTSLTAWETIIGKLSQQDFTDIDNVVASLGYELLRVTDNSATEPKIYYLLRRSSEGENFWGTYTFHFESQCTEKVVIQSPHPIKDSNTGKQGAFVFKHSGAYAFFLSGTDRCNNSTATTCSGTSSVCTGNSEAYKISDLAHNTHTPFQKATEMVHQNVDKSVFIQLHGFSKRDSDPYVIMSNGTKEVPSATDYALNFKNELSNVDVSLTFQLGHTNSDWTRLLGTTNTQGRFINGSSNPCNDAAETSTGRFIHLEQEFSKLRESEAGWGIVTKGLAKTFSCPAELITALNRSIQREQVILYPNPFKDLLHVAGDFPENSKLKILDLVGHVLHEVTIGSEKGIDVSMIKIPGIYYAIIEYDSVILSSSKILKQ